MRVTMINKYYPPHLGGIEYHLRDLSQALVARGHEVRALVANEGPMAVVETVDGVDVVRLGRAFAYASTPVVPGMAGAIKRVAKTSDLLHLHFPYPWGEVEWLRAMKALDRRGSRIPTVMTYHSDIVRQQKLLAMYEPLLKRVLDRVDLVMASSPNLIEHSPYLSRIADKCRVAPFGIPAEKYASTPAREARAAELRAGHERPIVLFVGRLIYYKGAEVLVRAMAEVDADLVLIGRGPLKPELEALVASLGIGDRVSFVDPVGDDDLAAWYRAADVFCLPSVARSEAFGLVQLEAHASGTPVVATTLSTGVPFVNQQGVTGLNVPPGDVSALAEALRTLVGDDELRARYGRQAYERVHADFTVERMVERVTRVYHEARGVA